MYHGTNHDIIRFSTEFVGRGNDQYGPGIYFTDNIDLAKSYGRNVYEADIVKARIRSARGSNLVSPVWITNVIKKNPDWPDSACNWSENPAKGLKLAVDSIIHGAEDYGDLIQSIWIEFFRGDESLYMDVLSSKLIDGIIYNVDRYKFLTLFNPNAIRHVRKISI